tara:strand:+ start:582 stop:1223 length:642 start_codon:yes stop_codon:yes gene_type:complete
MKKLLSIVSSLILVSTITAKADIGMGISGAFIDIDGDGTETTRTSNQVNKGSHSEELAVPEVFIELIGDNGGAVGLSYIPTRDLGSKSRSDTNEDGDTGTYKAQAELDNVLKLYGDMPLGSLAGGTSYLTVGLQHVELVTLESLNSGATYPNKNLFGYSVGLGLKGDLPYGSLYYKGEVTYTDFETYEADGAGNKVSADLDATTARLSIGYKF